MEILGRSSLSLSLGLSPVLLFPACRLFSVGFYFILFYSYSNDIIIRYIYLFLIIIYFSLILFSTCIISFFTSWTAYFPIHFAIVPHPTIRLLLACAAAAAAPRLLACLVPVALPIVPPLSLSCFFL